MRHTSISDPFLIVRNLGLLQRQAGVDPRVAELVVAHARLCVDGGNPFCFDEAAPKHPLQRRLFNYLAAGNPSADPRFVNFLAAYGAELTSRGLPPIYSVDHLLRQLALRRSQLDGICADVRQQYTAFQIPKKAGGVRQILSPHEPLRRVQQWILRRILDHLPPHTAAMAFVKKRSIAHNAQPHVGKAIVIRVDIQDFFPSVSFTAVRRVFQQAGYTYSVATVCATLCTVDGGLPQGGITSSALANLACRRLDDRFTRLGARLGFAYSRYADDLVFSSNDTRLPKLVPFIRDIVTSEQFTLNEKKTRVMRRGQQQLVTGLVVNDAVNCRRAHARQLRAAMHRLRARGSASIVVPSRGHGVDPVEALRGHVAFVRMINPRAADRLVR